MQLSAHRIILVERLNVAVLAGFPLGLAAMLWANRLLPVAMRGRAEWEIHVLFLAWAAAAVLSFVRRPAHAWVMILGSTGLLLASLPFYNMIATQRGIVAALVSGDWLMAGADLTLLVFGIAFFWAAARVAGYRPKARQRGKRGFTGVSETVLEPAE